MTSRLLLRLTIPIVGLSVLILATGGISAWYIQQLYREASREFEHYLHSASRANDLERSLWEVRERLMLFVLTGSDEHLAMALYSAVEASQRFEDSQGIETSIAGQRHIKRIRAQYDRFMSDLKGLAGDSRPQQQRDIENILNRTLPAALEEAHLYRDLNEQRLVQANLRIQTNVNRIRYTLWVASLAGAMVGLLGGYGVARALQESIVELSVPIHDAAGKLGEVVGPLRVKSSTQLEDLRTSLDSLATRVGTVVERLHAAQRESLRAEQLAATGQLAAGLAHELRNPLTAMKTLVQAARQQGGSHALDEQDLAILEEEMTRLSSTLQTFLDFARPPALARRRIAIKDVLAATTQLVAPRAAQQAIALETDVPDNLPAINADPDQLRQMLLNLVLNAFEALPQGGRVALRARPEPANSFPSKWLVLEVADNGAGLPGELGERIFEPFMSTKEAGTGLGLAISKRIVENHGGTITAGTDSSGGAVFTIRLPLAEAEPKAPPAAPRAATA